MAFHEVRFPANLSFGSVGGPERRTEVVALTNGFEERNTPWAEARRRYDAGVGMRSLDDIADLIAFFEARQGQLCGFRWKDWADYKSSRPSAPVAFDDQPIGTGDGVTADFPLVKIYASGGQAQQRAIRKPVAGTVRIGLQGDELQEGVHFAVDTATGVVHFAIPPAIGERITAGFEFDVPVRFDTDRIQVSVASFQAGDVPQVPVVEVRL
jgi:uncharacterized protein (TIGR02217 family)